MVKLDNYEILCCNIKKKLKTGDARIVHNIVSRHFTTTVEESKNCEGVILMTTDEFSLLI